MSACDTCRSEFTCGQLAMALRIIGTMTDLESRPALARAHAHVKRYLADAGWRFREARLPCALAGKDRLLTQLTESLIQALRADRPGAVPQSTRDAAASLIAEEL